MSFLSYLWVETKRLFHKKSSWFFIILALGTPLAGYQLYQPLLDTTTKSSIYLGNPAMAGAFGGAVLFAFFTLFELHHIYKNQTDVITEAIVSPVTLNLARVVSIIGIAVFTQILAILLYLPYTMIKMGSIFDFSLYIKIYLIIMFPTLLFSILFSASMYQITKRFDLSILLFILFILFSLNTKTKEDFILRWINPILWVLSDDFGNTRTLMSISWNRLFWLNILTGVWLFSILCTRSYKKNMLESFLFHIKKFYLPVLTVFFLAIGSFIYIKQPFVDHSAAIDPSYYNYSYNDAVFYSNVFVKIRPNVKTGRLYGSIAYELTNFSEQPQTISFTINPGYKISNLKANDKKIFFHTEDNINYNEKEFTVNLPPEKNIILTMDYGGFPQEWNLTKTMQGRIEISSEYIFLTNEQLFPLPKNIGSSDPFFQGEIIIPKDFTAVLTGSADIECISENKDGTKTWRFQKNNLSTKLLAADLISENFVTFVSDNLKTPQIPVQFIYSAKHKQIMDNLNITELFEEVLEYCNKNIGIMSYYTMDGLKIIELSAYIAGGIAEWGSSTMDEGCFSEDALKDRKKGATGIEIVAHEIIHQWWGLSVMIQSQNEFDPWTSEGLTTYTTYRLMKEKFGEEYAKKNYVDVWKKDADTLSHNFYYRYPKYLYKLPQEYAEKIKTAQNTILQYSIMPLKILKAEELVGGEEAMDNILHNLYMKGISNSYIDYQDFLNACGLEKEDLELD